MKDLLHRIGITTRKGLQVRSVLENLVHCLTEQGKEVYLSESARAEYPDRMPENFDFTDLPAETNLDLLIVVGGDGTILSAVRKLHSLECCVLGINVGNLGFLSELPASNFENTCLQIQEGNFTLDERLLLRIIVTSKNGTMREYRALNEVVVSQSAVARLVEIPTRIDGIEITRFRADGLIVATPTGSTAYNLSAGGPIVHPKVEAFILTPIAPFAFSQKPLVIPAEKVITLEILPVSREEIVLTVDGQVNDPLTVGDIIEISRFPEKVKFLRLMEENYFTTLRNKLRWGERL